MIHLFPNKPFNTFNLIFHNHGYWPDSTSLYWPQCDVNYSKETKIQCNIVGKKKKKKVYSNVVAFSLTFHVQINNHVRNSLNETKKKKKKNKKKKQPSSCLNGFFY